jgi:hypothetical protein
MSACEEEEGNRKHVSTCVKLTYGSHSLARAAGGRNYEVWWLHHYQPSFTKHRRINCTCGEYPTHFKVIHTEVTIVSASHSKTISVVVLRIICTLDSR